MTSPAFRRRLFALAFLLASALPVHAAGEWDLARLMTQLANRSEGRATFTETKHIAILDQPVVSSGELRFRAPDRLEKLTLKPHRESMVLEGDTLTLARDDKRHVVKLSDYPQASAFVDSIRGTLAGDRAALERTYALHLAGDRARWTLALLPRDPKMGELVSRITIRGTGAALDEIEILQADGDRSVMTIREVAPKP